MSFDQFAGKPWPDVTIALVAVPLLDVGMNGSSLSYALTPQPPAEWEAAFNSAAEDYADGFDFRAVNGGIVVELPGMVHDLRDLIHAHEALPELIDRANKLYKANREGRSQLIDGFKAYLRGVAR